MGRLCAFRMPNGEPCRASPMCDGDFCFVHSPEHAREAQEARRLGGLRRKREATVSIAYDFEHLDTVAGIRRLVEVAVMDTLGMENSIARNRTLAYLAQVALRTLEVGELQQRIAALEQAIGVRRIQGNRPAFELEPDLPAGNRGEEP